MSDTPKLRLSGPARAAIVMLALGEDVGGKLLAKMNEDEIREVSAAMARLGSVPAEVVEALCSAFVTDAGRISPVAGSPEVTERLLRKSISDERAAQILDEIRGPGGKTIWDKLAKVNESVLAAYLQQEHPQTIAVILSRLASEHAARILALFPDKLSVDVVERMLGMDGVPQSVIEDIERTLRADFTSILSAGAPRDPHNRLAEIFNGLDRQTEARLMSGLEERDAEAAARIKSLMFTFEDLARLAPTDVQTLLRAVDRETLPIAMRGASDKMREFFFSNLSERASKMLREEIEALGPVRVRDIDAAQLAITILAKELAASGEIEIGSGKEDDLVI